MYDVTAGARGERWGDNKRRYCINVRIEEEKILV